MTDTSAALTEKYRTMLLARSAEQRLKMACSMSATARALAGAGVRAQKPGACVGAVRGALFLRLYGHEFGAEERERIIERLGRAESVRVPAMRRPTERGVDATTAPPERWG